MEQTCQIGVWMGFCATLKIQREKLGERRSGKVSGLVGGKQVSAWICAGARSEETTSERCEEPYRTMNTPLSLTLN